MQDEHEVTLATQARASNHRRHDPDDETDVSVSHIFPCFMKHRVWKRQPRGGPIGVGTVPSRIILFFPSLASTVGTADSSALLWSVHSHLCFLSPRPDAVGATTAS